MKWYWKALERGLKASEALRFSLLTHPKWLSKSADIPMCIRNIAQVTIPKKSHFAETYSQTSALAAELATHSLETIRLARGRPRHAGSSFEHILQTTIFLEKEDTNPPESPPVLGSSS